LVGSENLHLHFTFSFGFSAKFDHFFIFTTALFPQYRAMQTPEEFPLTYQDRDLSWLSFNARILQEAADKRVPLFERVKFLAIYSANLDEFFRVRIATLRSLVKVQKKKLRENMGFTPEETLEKALEIVEHQQKQFGQVFREQLLPELAEKGIILYQERPTSETHRQFIRKYFKSKVLGYLRPYIFESKGDVPFLKNKALYLVVALERLREDGETPDQFHALLNVPTESLPRFVKLPPMGEKHYFVFLDDVIRENLTMVFPGYAIKGCYSIKLNRNADLLIDDEFTGDLVEKIRKHLSKRNVGSPSRFLYDEQMPETVLKLLKDAFHLNKPDLVAGGRYHNFNDLFSLPNPFAPNLANEPQEGLAHPALDRAPAFFHYLHQQELMLHFPYHSYDYVLQFFNEAAIDPFVEDIKLTVYRIAATSFIANALISAARNGKKVTVFVEVKARFDEENNLMWAQRMEKEGIKIIYSHPGLKVHAKVALISRKVQGKKVGYAFLGTGNFNENTAKTYADHGLFTADPRLTEELRKVFKFLSKMKEKPALEHLLVAQINMRGQFMALIDREIEAALLGEEAHIVIKLNNLEDQVMIDKLYEASQAGVKVELIVRGICCLMPEVKGMSDNITVTRIVDRYLEHARVFVFHNRGDKAVLLGSADWMRRNLYKRVEVVYPVYDEQIKSEILEILALQLKDNTKAVFIDRYGQNVTKSPSFGGAEYRAQKDTYQLVKQWNQGATH